MTKRRRVRTSSRRMAIRRLPPWAIALLLLALIVYRLGAWHSSDHDRYHNHTFLCVRVVDGDTIDVAVPDGDSPHTRVRLWGVDTPEVGRGRAKADYYASEAAAFVSSLVLDRPVRLVLVPDRTRGRYGRLLAYVYLADADGQTMLNEAIIAEGFGYADPRFDHPWKVKFADLERRARREEAGLWREVTPEQMPDWRQRYESWKAEQVSP